MNNKPTSDEIKQDIENFDHGKSMPKTGKNLFVGQIKSGVILILVIPVIPLGIEYHLNYNWHYYVIVASLIGYVILELFNFKKYDQMQPLKKS